MGRSYREGSLILLHDEEKVHYRGIVYDVSDQCLWIFWDDGEVSSYHDEHGGIDRWIDNKCMIVEVF